MGLDQQIQTTEQELKAYKSSKFSAPEIIDWLESVLDSLYKLRHIEDK